MPNVNDLAKMYGQPASNSNSFLHSKSNDQNTNVPAWKLELQKNRAKKESGSGVNNNTSVNKPSWKTNDTSNGPVNKPWEKPQETPPKPAWQKPKPIVPNTTSKPPVVLEKTVDKPEEPTPPSKPAWARPKPIVINETTEFKPSPASKPWEKPKPDNTGDNAPPWLRKQDQEKNKQAPFSTASTSHSFPSPVEDSKSNDSPSWRTGKKEPPWRISNEVSRSNSSSSSGTNSRSNSFLSQNKGPPNGDRPRINSFNVNPEGPPLPIGKPPPTANKSSFLHHKPPSPGSKPVPPLPNSMNLPPQRKTIPDHLFRQPAPVKPNRPGFVQVQSSWVLSHESVSKLPSGSRHQKPLPSPNSGGAPPLPAYPHKNELPPPPPGSSLPPPLPGRSQIPSSGHSPLPISQGDDLYDDTDVAAPPPLPPTNNKRQLSRTPTADAIPTWDDEDDGLYDETAPETDNNFGGQQSQDPIPEEDSELYEDVETYMKFKAEKQKEEKAQADKRAKEDEKRNKEKKKKEKEMRKKFSIKEGEIRVEFEGVVKENAKGSGKDLAVQKQQTIEIIRMVDNPKGKWLVRNTEGKYGYVESDNIDINTNRMKNQMQSIRQTNPYPGSFAPPPIDQDAIYDETAEEEDVYEEV